MNSTQSKSNGPSAATKWLRIVLLVAFLIAAFLTALLTFISVRDLVTSWELTSLPGVTIRDATSTPDAAGVINNPDIPLQPAGSGPTAPSWDGASRVTVLIMGLDYRDWESKNGPPRTDTMILFTVDPLSRTAGMLSVPRDLWVNIPGGFSYGRINTAYMLGEGSKMPGGGPQLAMDTVEELLGVPIDFYAQIDFEAFIKFIDEIGGVKIDVPQKITIDPLGSNNTYRLKAGVQVLNGELALAYARARHTEGGDFDRAQRQQQVIMGIRNQILRYDMLPTLVAKSGLLYSELSSGIHTNLTLDQAMRLAWLASQIPEENIKKGIIAPPDQVTFATSPDGSQQVLKPITEKIRLLRDQIFTNTGPVSPVAASMDPAELMKTEAAKVSIMNATQTAGLAALTGDYLKSLGVNVTSSDNAQQTLTYTEITFYTGKPYTVKYLVDLMKINPNRIHHHFDPTSPVDVTISVGADWANSNTMP
jgi:polyisoprenyl-teichoic acid--peptidoglycan teichoic acid transferase